MTKGVKQGDPISPKLFTACLESVFRKLNWKQVQKGIKIGDDIISNFRFADDIAIFGNSLKELKVMLEDLSRESAKVELFMNFTKTKVMTNKFVTDKTRITVQGTEIEEVDQYLYLGQIIRSDGSKEIEIKRRIALGWQAISGAKMIFSSKKMSLINKRKVYNQCILPTVTYGAETWKLSQKMMMNLRAMQRAQERSMMGMRLQDCKEPSWIREQTKVRNTLETVHQMKWN